MLRGSTSSTHSNTNSQRQLAASPTGAASRPRGVRTDAASSSLVKAPAESIGIEGLAPEAELSAALNDDDPAGVGAGAASAPVTPVRTLGPKLEPADLELALRYLSSFGVIVTATPLPEAALAVIAEAAAYNGAQLVVVSEAGEAQGLIEGATVLQAPGDDPDHRFAELVGQNHAARHDSPRLAQLLLDLAAQRRRPAR